MLFSDDQLKSLLLKSKALDAKSIGELVDFAENTRVPLQEAILEKKILEDQKLGSLIANYLKIPFIDSSKLKISNNAFQVIPERIARKYKVIAFERTSREIKIALEDPQNTNIAEMLAKKTSKKVIAYLATGRDINSALELYKKNLQESVDKLLKVDTLKQIDVVSDMPIVKIVDMIIAHGYRDKASDIHIEPEEENLLIRFRIDSVLQDALYLNRDFHSRIVTRVKVLAKLRTDEHQSAQDGKLRLQVDDENLDIRVSIIPTTEGEKVVLRLLSSRFRSFALSDLGMNVRDLKKVNAVVNKGHGMILSSGPTGSGKTTTIYSILKTLNTKDKNITTIEDPVEYRIKGVNQIQVNQKTNLTFANGLRSVLRQDPNIIFVGEIRDSETASIATNAALTGHLVLSTLHTNDAATSPPRLIDMRVEPFLVASTVNLIIAQRLVRKICTSCKISKVIKKDEMPKDIPEAMYKTFFRKNKKAVVYEGKGCKECHFTGYSGRIGVFEVIEMTEKIRKLIVQKKDSSIIEKAAIKEGMMTMLENGLSKVSEGITTIDEVLRITKTDGLG